MQSVEKIYKKNIESNKEKAHDLKLKMNLISIFRLVTVILCISIDYILYRNNNINIALIVTLFFIIIFMLLVLLHDILFNQKKRFEILIKINEDGLNIIYGNLDNGFLWLDFIQFFSFSLVLSTAYVRCNNNIFMVIFIKLIYNLFPTILLILTTLVK